MNASIDTEPVDKTLLYYVTDLSFNGAFKSNLFIIQFLAFVPVGSMLPWSPIPPLGGYQLIRDPATGQLIVFPSSNTLGMGILFIHDFINYLHFK